MHEVTHFKLAIRDSSAPNELKAIDIDSFNPNDDRKKLFVFPGNLTVDERIAGDVTEAMENMLFPHLQKSETSVPHPGPQTDNILKLRQAQYKDTNLRNNTDIYVLIYNKINKALITQEFFDSVMIKLIAKRDSLGNFCKIDADVAAKNMRNFIGVTHCFGSYIVKALDTELKKTLSSLGYLPDEQALIARQWVSFHHNNVDEELGMYNPVSTQLQRISQSDLARNSDDYMKGSFQRYLKAMPLKEDKLDIINLSKNELAFLVPSVTNSKSDEHQYGYWNRVAARSKAGEIEYKAFKLLLDEVLQSDYMIKDISQLWHNAVSHNNASSRQFSSCQKSGDEYWSSYKKYNRMVDAAAYLAANTLHLR